MRNRLGVWAIAWLLCQVASLAALLPPDCCAAHHAVTAGDKECHQPAAAGEQCPMLDANGAPCPMHQTAADEAADATCRMRGTCQGPAVALGALFSVPGVLVEPASVAAPALDTPVVIAAVAISSAPFAFDPPPPRA